MRSRRKFLKKLVSHILLSNSSVYIVGYLITREHGSMVAGAKCSSGSTFQTCLPCGTAGPSQCGGVGCGASFVSSIVVGFCGGDPFKTCSCN